MTDESDITGLCSSRRAGVEDELSLTVGGVLQPSEEELCNDRELWMEIKKESCISKKNTSID